MSWSWSNWSNWGNVYHLGANFTATPDTVTDGEAFDPITNSNIYYGNQGGYVTSFVISVGSPTAGDELFLDLSGTTLTATGNQIYSGATLIATVSGGVDGTPLTIAPATQASTQSTHGVSLAELVGAVRYVNDDSAEAYTRTVTVQTHTSNVGTFSASATVTAVAGASEPEVDLLGTDPGIGAGTVAATISTGSNNASPAVAALADGYVATWRAYDSVAGEYQILVQRLDSAGQPVGAAVALDLPSTDETPSIAALEDGGYIVTWMSSTIDGNSSGVAAQRFDSTGALSGSTFQVNSVIESSQYRPFVAGLPDGGFIVAWQDSLQDGNSAGIFARRYDSDGVPDGAEFQVNSDATSEQLLPSIAVLDGGGFVIAFGSAASGTYRATFRLYDADGNAVGVDTEALSESGFNHTTVSVTALAGGGFVILSPGLDGDGNGLIAQIFDSSGAAAGNSFVVNSAVSGFQGYGSVTALSDGGFLVTYSSNAGGSYYNLVARRFSAEGRPLGDEFVVASQAGVHNYGTFANQPNVTELADGSVAFVWSANNQTVMTRVFELETAGGLEGMENVALAIPLTLEWPDQDGSETLEVVLSGYPVGATFNLGAAGPGGTWIISLTDPDEIGTLVMTPPQGWSGNFDLVVHATSTETSNSETASDTMTIAIRLAEAPNDDPTLQLSDDGSGATLAYTENDAPAPIAPTAVLGDVDSPSFDTGTLTVSLQANGGPTDQLGIQDQGTGVGQIGVSGNDVTYANVVIGTYTGGDDGTELVVTLDADASPEAVQALVRAVTYHSTSDDPGTASRTVNFLVTDGEGGSAQANAAVNVTAENDAPTLVLADDTIVGTEDTDIVFSSANSNAITVADVDNATLTVTLTVLNGALTLSQTTGLTVTGDGTGTVELSGSAADINAALEGLTYRGTLNYEGSDTLSVLVDDGTDSVTDDIAITLADDGAIDGTSGDDVAVTGTASGDIFDLSQSGDDEADGLGGNDGFYMGAALSAGDDLDGGAGSNDQLILQGNVTATILANHLQNIEALVLLTGGDSRFGDTTGNLYDYSITMTDAAVDAGERLNVWAAGLVVGEDFYFDGSAETDGHFTIYAGFGVDHLTGGHGNDYFFFGPGGRFTADDRVVGNGGAQDQLGLRGDYSTRLEFQDDTISGVDSIILISGSDANYGPPAAGFGYNILSHDANVAAGETLSVWGINLTSSEIMIFDGSSETNGQFRLFGGAANDVLIGGAGNDMIFGALGADTLSGGGGNDTFVYRSVAESTSASGDAIISFFVGDRVDLSAIDADGAAAGNQAFAFVGSNAFSNTAGELRATNVLGNEWAIEGDVDGDGAADFYLTVYTADADPITTADFIL